MTKLADELDEIRRLGLTIKNVHHLGRAADMLRLLAAQSAAPVGEDIVEVWHGGRKVTIYPDCVLRVWGTNIHDEMSDEPRNLNSVQSALDWLYSAPAPSPPEVSGWQPIETAPADKEILGFQATPGDNENRIAVCWAYVMAPKAVWIGHGGLMPTHWMPLPANPGNTEP